MTVTTVVAYPPQLAVYEITAVPAATPVTTPELLTEATDGKLLLHAPPVDTVLRLSVLPGQTLPVPVIADGPAVTLNVVVF